MPVRRPGCRSAVVPLTVLVGSVCVGCSVAGTPLRGPGSTTSVTSTSRPSASAGPEGQAAPFERLVTALATDLRAGRAPDDTVVDGSDPGWRPRLAALARGARAAGLDRYQLHVDPHSLRVSGDRATLSAVGSYHVRGAAPASAPVVVALQARRTPRGWRLAGGDDQGSVPVPWGLPGVRRLDGPTGVVVLGNAPDATLRWYARAASAAWSDVAPAWPRRPAGAPVVVVPATPEQFAEQVRPAARDVTDIAAMTIGSLRRGRTARGDAVVVNPVVQQRLTEEGRRTILRHELVHVAVRGTTTGPVPLWLTEGYAVQASWNGRGVPDQLRTRARGWAAGQRRPVRLPTDASLTARDPTHAYDISAVLVDDLVTRHGRAAVIACYERTAAGATFATAAAQTLGESPATVVSHWQAALARLAQSRAATGPP